MQQKERFASSLSDDGRYRMLIEAVTDYAIYMLDADGRISSWNPGARRVKGYEESEILGEHFSRFYTAADRESGLPQRALAIAAREGKFEGEGWRCRKDGTRFWAYVVIDPIKDAAGNVVGYAKITRDLTERKEAERALQEAREALFQSQKMEAVGQLTGGVAHDFNNLLMAVLGSLELLRKRLPADPKMMRLVDNAIQAAQRGAGLTQRMLAFARRQELKPVALDVAGLVRGMTDLLHSSLGATAQIETDFPAGLNKILADPNQLELAILNLAVNARDAMPKGGTIVIAAREENVATAPDLKAGRYVCLSVADQGCGMDEATRMRALEPFFTTKGVGKGTGLGLSMVHGMTQQSGGKLVLKSAKDEGTTAELWFPVAATGAGHGPDQAAFRPTDARAGRLVILAVDDDALVLFNTVAMLEDLGHTALEATSAKAALETIRREGRIDLVITDQAMPNMSGSDLAAAIRSERPELPIILATGFAELPPDADKTLPTLSKPFRQHQLADVIAKTVTPAAACGLRSR
jgi:PAS domain S-box-containing protein